MFYFIHKYSGGFDMLFLSEQEMWQSITLEDVMDAIEDAYAIHKSGNYKMPDRFIAQRDKNMMLYMPCFLDSVIGTKMLSEFPDNSSLGIPYLNGLMILNNAKTGLPKAIMNGSVLTAMRTGAVGGVALRYLAPEDAASVVHKLAEATNLPTDNKELRKKTNNTLEEFLNTLTQKLSLLQYVEDNGFHASDYLRKKAYILLSETDNKNSSGTTAHDRKERTPRERVSRERKRIEVPNDILHPELYRKITEWRGTKAKETGMPAYVIIQQKALLGMVNLLPNDAESLEAVPYFGRKGVENYGLELLGIIRNYMKEQNLQRPEIRTVFVPRENKKNKEDTKKVSFRLFKEGMKVKEIAEFRELTTGTISNHLLHYVRTGDIKLQELVDQEKINYITAHLQKFSSLPQGVKEIKEKLGEYTSYDEIRFVFEAYKKHIPA